MFLLAFFIKLAELEDERKLSRLCIINQQIKINL